MKFGERRTIDYRERLLAEILNEHYVGIFLVLLRIKEPATVRRYGQGVVKILGDFDDFPDFLRCEIEIVDGLWRIGRHEVDPARSDTPEGILSNRRHFTHRCLVVHGEFYAAEPNHQEIDRISPTIGAVHRVADISASSSDWVGPTGIVYHGNLFFGNLAPFPIVPGSASVHKLTPSGNFKIWDRGFTTVVGVAFDHRDRLYVLELSDASGFPTPGEGRLVRVSPSGEVEEILGGLVVPTAMTIGPDGAIYISNFGAAPPGAGQILRLEIQ